jgi:hypothetical protein
VVAQRSATDSDAVAAQRPIRTLAATLFYRSQLFPRRGGRLGLGPVCSTERIFLLEP